MLLIQNQHVLEIGNGHVNTHPDYLRCTIDKADGQTYHDAQIDDYTGLKRRHFPWRAPLRMCVEASFSHPSDQLVGTAGFGFWNQPYMPGEAFFRLPRATWFFFGSPPNDMRLALGVPGYGWKSATFDASRRAFLALAPFAPLGFLLMRVPLLYRWLWPLGQRSLGVSEQVYPDVDITQKHRYELEWLPHAVRFSIDGTLLHHAPHAPSGALGFIAWIDNQFAVVTPQGRFRQGFIPVPEAQWLDLFSIEIEKH